MAKLAAIESGFYRIPRSTVLTDSTHGQMRAFELNTVRLKDSDGAEGVGYTFTVGRNGGAIAAVLAREMPELFVGEEAGDGDGVRGLDGGARVGRGRCGHGGFLVWWYPVGWYQQDWPEARRG